MRRLLPLLFAAAPLAHAQATVGVRAGLNVTDSRIVITSLDEIDSDETEFGGADQSATLGFVGGIFAEIPVTPAVSFRPETLYTQKGFRVKSYNGTFRDPESGQTSPLDISQSFHADYLEVPLLACVSVPVGPRLNVGVMAGPSFAVKVRESLDTRARINGESVPPETFTAAGQGRIFKTVDVGA